MIISTLVQNYYERHGSFAGIEKQSFADELSRSAQEFGGRLIDYYYSLLGYEKLESLGDSIADAVQARRAYVAKDSDTLNRMFGQDKGASEYKEEMAECSKYVRSRSSSIARRDMKKAMSALKDPCTWGIVQLLLTTSDKIVHVGPVCLTPLAHFEQCKLNAQDTASLFVKGEDNAYLILKGIDAPKDTLLQTQGDTIYFNENSTTYEEAAELLQAAVQCIICIKLYLKNRGVKRSTVPTLAFSNLELYTFLLDFAALLGLSYAELSLFVGCSVPDLVRAYEQTGYVFKICDNIVVFQDAALAAQNVLQKTTLTEFIVMLQVTNPVEEKGDTTLKKVGAF